MKKEFLRTTGRRVAAAAAVASVGLAAACSSPESFENAEDAYNHVKQDDKLEKTYSQPHIAEFLINGCAKDDVEEGTAIYTAVPGDNPTRIAQKLATENVQTVINEIKGQASNGSGDDPIVHAGDRYALPLSQLDPMEYQEYTPGTYFGYGFKGNEIKAYELQEAPLVTYIEDK